MKRERYKQIDELFQAALERRPEERRAFLDASCAADSVLRSEVEALLSSDQQAKSFIESPASELGPELFKKKLSENETVGPYKIAGQLGAGGMGQVYLAEDSRLKRRVALKLLDRSLLGDTESRQRFIREAQLASALDHPNICTIFEVGEADDQCFIGMQYVEGKTLKEVIDKQPLLVERLLSISLEVADALSTAHRQGIVHRDIKSSNILITPRGQAKVLDFGIAKPLQEESQPEAELTRTGAILGTAAYMSPEQARGERVDQRSDIFSFGVVMYEMATGELPFQEKSQPEVMNAVINKQQIAAVERNQDLPVELSKVIDRALAKQPEDRYQSAEELVAALGKIKEDLTTAKLEPSTLRYVAPRQHLSARLNILGFGRTRKAILTILAVAALIALGYYLRQRQTIPTAESPVLIRSIAVLPFKPLTEGNRDEALEMGMADTLITRLSGLKTLEVRPITAVRKYTDSGQDPTAVGREQRVDAVLDGSIQKSGDEIRVTVRLVRTADAAQIWTEKFDEKFTNIFSLQDSISERVAGALAVRLTGEERQRLTKRYTENTEAYQLYLIGRNHLNGRTEERITKSIDYFEKAIQIDANYALAYAGLADSYILLAFYSDIASRDAFSKAKGAVARALELDDNLAEAHTSSAGVLSYYDWNWPEAEKEFRRAIDLNPNYPTAHHWFSQHLLLMGRFDEAIAEAKRARELDPLSPIVNCDLGHTLRLAGRVDEAIEQLNATVEMHPNFSYGHFLLGIAYVEKRNYEKGIGEMQKARALAGGNVAGLGALGYAYAVSGKRDEALRVLADLNRLAKQQHVSPFASAGIYLGLGDNERAMQQLEKSYQERDWHLRILKEEPFFNALKSDPRYIDLLTRMGLSH
jgi:serine/threonine-protein kinase